MNSHPVLWAFKYLYLTLYFPMHYDVNFFSSAQMVLDLTEKQSECKNVNLYWNENHLEKRIFPFYCDEKVILIWENERRMGWRKHLWKDGSQPVIRVTLLVRNLRLVQVVRIIVHYCRVSWCTFEMLGRYLKIIIYSLRYTKEKDENPCTRQNDGINLLNMMKIKKRSAKWRQDMNK